MHPVPKVVFRRSGPWYSDVYDGSADCEANNSRGRSMAEGTDTGGRKGEVWH